MSAASVRTIELVEQRASSDQLVLNRVVRCWGLVSLLLFSCGATSLVGISAHSLSANASPCVVDLVGRRSACRDCQSASIWSVELRASTFS